MDPVISKYPLPLVRRLPGNPIIRPHMDARMGDNINGPSLIRVPDWIENPLGRYYLYFSHHDGRYIRLAHADDLAGPWQIHSPGTLSLEESQYAGHIASPDVHVDNESRQIRMYFHGAESATGKGGRQSTRLALSKNGLNFTTRPEILGRPYFRAFQWQGDHYAIGMPGVIYRSSDGLSSYEEGPTLFSPNMRHCALMVEGDSLLVFYTDVGNTPERILLSTIELTSDWRNWQESEPALVLEPEMVWEGGDQPLLPSVRGLVDGPVRQLRDPAIFTENGQAWLLYSVAGETGIAIAELAW